MKLGIQKILILGLFFNSLLTSLSYGKIGGKKDTGIFLKYIQKPSSHELSSMPAYPLSKGAYQLTTSEDKSEAIINGGYTKEIEILNSFKRKLKPQEYSVFLDWYLSHFVFSQIKVMVDNGNSPEAGPFHGLSRYNKENEYPLDGVVAAKSYLHNIPLQDLTISHIMNVHRITLSKESVKKNHSKKPSNCEEFKDGSLGKLRNKLILWKILPNAKAEKEKPIEERRKLSDISTDAYGRKLPFHDWATTTSPKSYATLSDVNPLLAVDPDDYEVYYAPLGKWRQYEYALTSSTIKLIERTEKEFIENGEEVDYDKPYTVFEKNMWIKSDVGQYVYRKFIFDLLNYTLEKLKNELNEAKTKSDVLWAATRFFRDFISIHPFEDGNGRTSKIILSKILNDYNIPAPIFVDPGIDVVYSYEDLYHSLMDSITLSKLFHSVLEYCSENNIFYGVASPGFTKDDMNGSLGINIETFITWIAYFSPSEKSRTMGAFYKPYNEWLQEIAQLKDGHVARPINTTFFRMFNRSSSSIAAYNFKMSYSYFRGNIVFYPKVNHKYKVDKLLRLFDEKRRELNGKNQKEKLNKTANNFHKFNKTLINMRKFEALSSFDGVNLLTADKLDDNEKPKFICDGNSKNQLQIMARRPSEGFLMVDKKIFIPTGVDFESVNEVKYCQIKKGKALLTTLKRINVFTVQVNQYKNGEFVKSYTASIGKDQFQVQY